MAQVAGEIARFSTLTSKGTGSNGVPHRHPDYLATGSINYTLGHWTVAP